MLHLFSLLCVDKVFSTLFKKLLNVISYHQNEMRGHPCLPIIVEVSSELETASMRTKWYV
jgi:hypothetical protein